MNVGNVSGGIEKYRKIVPTYPVGTIIIYIVKALDGEIKKAGCVINRLILSNTEAVKRNAREEVSIDKNLTKMGNSA